MTRYVVEAQSKNDGEWMVFGEFYTKDEAEAAYMAARARNGLFRAFRIVVATSQIIACSSAGELVTREQLIAAGALIDVSQWGPQIRGRSWNIAFTHGAWHRLVKPDPFFENDGGKSAVRRILAAIIDDPRGQQVVNATTEKPAYARYEQRIEPASSDAAPMDVKAAWEANNRRKMFQLTILLPDET